MTMDQNEILKRTYTLANENNKLLKSMRRRAFFGGLLKWAIRIGVAFIAFWLYTTILSPIILQGRAAISQIQNTADSTGVDTSKVKEFLNKVDTNTLNELKEKYFR